MRMWFISLGLIVSLASGVIGISAHESEGSCPMGNMPNCCKKAHSVDDTAEVSMARLCYKLNYSEPVSDGNANFSSFSSQAGNVPSIAMVPNAYQVNRNARHVPWLT